MVAHCAIALNLKLPVISKFKGKVKGKRKDKEKGMFQIPGSYAVIKTSLKLPTEKTPFVPSAP